MHSSFISWAYCIISSYWNLLYVCKDHCFKVLFFFALKYSDVSENKNSEYITIFIVYFKCFIPFLCQVLNFYHLWNVYNNNFYGSTKQSWKCSCVYDLLLSVMHHNYIYFPETNFLVFSNNAIYRLCSYAVLKSDSFSTNSLEMPLSSRRFMSKS